MTDAGFAGNRSLLRGLDLLRAFRPGTDLLGNAELAERTGLPRPTVSRLSRTLVAAGFLEHDPVSKAFRLAAPILSLGLAMRMSSPLLAAAAGPMRQASDAAQANVGLATADRLEMVYLESVRYNRRVALRNVVAGQRIPIERTSLGRAYLHGLDAPARERVMAQLERRQPRSGPDYVAASRAALSEIARRGFCATSWLPGVTALATPVIVPNHPVHALNMSVTSDEPSELVVARLGPPLLDLARRLRTLLDAPPGGVPDPPRA